MFFLYIKENLTDCPLLGHLIVGAPLGWLCLSSQAFHSGGLHLTSHVLHPGDLNFPSSLYFFLDIFKPFFSFPHELFISSYLHFFSAASSLLSLGFSLLLQALPSLTCLQQIKGLLSFAYLQCSFTYFFLSLFLGSLVVFFLMLLFS